MNRQIQTVAIAWKEYKIGINGFPSIESLVLAKIKWRKYHTSRETNTEAKFFSRRMKLIRAINARVGSEDCTAADAVKYFEEMRGDSGRFVS